MHSICGDSGRAPEDCISSLLAGDHLATISPNFYTAWFPSRRCTPTSAPQCNGLRCCGRARAFPRRTPAQRSGPAAAAEAGGCLSQLPGASRRWPESLFQLNASMPLPSSPSTPHDVAGNLNLTAHFEAGLAGTAGDVMPSAYTIDPATGAAYMFQLHPLVEEVAPAAGALQGEGLRAWGPGGLGAWGLGAWGLGRGWGAAYLHHQPGGKGTSFPSSPAPSFCSRPLGAPAGRVQRAA
jgi:hypothetical protein